MVRIGVAPAFGAVCEAASRAHDDAPRQTFVVKPDRIVIGDARGKNFAFPSRRRHLKAFKLRDRRSHGGGPFQTRVFGYMLPGEQEPQEVAGGDGLDLGAQTFDGVMMDARQQPPVAPFLALAPGEKLPRIAKPSASSAASADAISSASESERRGQSPVGDRPQALQPTAQDFDERGLESPRLARHDRAAATMAGRSQSIGPQRAELRQSVRPRPRCSTPSRHSLAARFWRASVSQPVAPARRFVDAEEAQP